MEYLRKLIGSRQGWLMHRILQSALERGYAGHASLLADVWRASRDGLSKVLLTTLQETHALHRAYDGEEDAQNVLEDLASQLTAEYHQSDIDLGTLLGLFKCCRQGTQDLVQEVCLERDDQVRYQRSLSACFDRLEIALVTEWSRVSEGQALLATGPGSADSAEARSTLVAICAKCKRIRDHHRKWQQLEAYFGEHFGVTFTHGFCPECVSELYPDLSRQGEADDGSRSRLDSARPHSSPDAGRNPQLPSDHAEIL